MQNTINISGEQQIIWIEPVTELANIRESIVHTPRRRSAIHHYGAARVVGYSVLGLGTKAETPWGFARRVFWVAGNKSSVEVGQ